MTILQDIQSEGLRTKLPDLTAGLTVRVHQKIKEGEKYRIQVFEGLIIKLNSGHGIDKTFTVRKIVEGVGVEKVFPLHSPLIEKIEIKKESKVRRSKLYYMRKRAGKSARMKEDFIGEEELAAAKEKEAKEQDEQNDTVKESKTQEQNAE